jgi:hypothetical protein
MIPRRIEGPYRANLYIDAGEASVWRSSPMRRQTRRLMPPGATNAVRSRLRRLTAIRRYAASNGLDVMVTLTWRGDGCHDLAAASRAARAFVGRLRRGLGGRFPYITVKEWHAVHGIHVHVLLPGTVPSALVRSAWPLGESHLRRFGRPGESALDAARAAARYVAKDGRQAGEPLHKTHRYEVAQGFQPALEEMTGSSRRQLIERLAARMGGLPDRLLPATKPIGPHATRLEWSVPNGSPEARAREVGRWRDHTRRRAGGNADTAGRSPASDASEGGVAAQNDQHAFLVSARGRRARS